MYREARASNRYRSSGSLRSAYILSMAFVRTSRDSTRANMSVIPPDIEADGSNEDSATIDAAALLLLMLRDSLEAGLGMNSFLPTKV